MELLNNAKCKAKELKAKWDGLPEDARKTCVVLGVGSVAALYFYNCGYNWAWKCAKHYFQGELRDILDDLNLNYANVLNSVSSMEELEEAGRSDKFMYEFVDFLGRKARVGLRFAADSQGNHTA